MTINSLLQRLTPSYKKTFFSQFGKNGSNISDMAVLLKDFINAKTSEESPALMSRMSALYERSDLLNRELMMQLKDNFITPFDREDIYELGRVIHKIAGHIHQTASKLSLYIYGQHDPETIRLSDLMLECSIHLKNILSGLGTIVESRMITDDFLRISRIKKEADHIYDKTVSEMISTGRASNLIKLGDILSSQEAAIKGCREAMLVVENVLIK